MKDGCVRGKRGAYTNTVCVCDPSTKDLCNLHLEITNGVALDSYSPLLLIACLMLLCQIMASN